MELRGNKAAGVSKNLPNDFNPCLSTEQCRFMIIYPHIVVTDDNL